MTVKKDPRRLKIGVLGCGPIAQAAHLESAAKARNAELYAICDVAEDLLERMACAHAPQKTFRDYDAMLADPEVDAVIVATADAFHVPAAIAALKAGKHVLCEKPLGVSVEEVEELGRAVRDSGRVLQVGHMKRFDAGLAERQGSSSTTEMGELLALKAWYCDSTHRYELTDAVQPLIVRSGSVKAAAERPEGGPRSVLHAGARQPPARHRALSGRRDRRGGCARLRQRFGAYCWFVDVAFANGALGHLDLTVAVRMDWHEGFQIYGEHGSVLGKTYNPWLYKTSDVEIFHEATGDHAACWGPTATSTGGSWKASRTRS